MSPTPPLLDDMLVFAEFEASGRWPHRVPDEASAAGRRLASFFTGLESLRRVASLVPYGRASRRCTAGLADESAVVLVTGNGIKDTRSALQATRPPLDLPPDPETLDPQPARQCALPSRNKPMPAKTWPGDGSQA